MSKQPTEAELKLAEQMELGAKIIREGLEWEWTNDSREWKAPHTQYWTSVHAIAGGYEIRLKPPVADADGWIAWDGGGKAPITEGEVRMRNGSVSKGLVGAFYWNHAGADHDIVAYRLGKPEPVLVPLEACDWIKDGPWWIRGNIPEHEFLEMNRASINGVGGPFAWFTHSQMMSKERTNDGISWSKCSKPQTP